ncbi:MAG: tetratricopeptide repeat protein, partial [Acholeplasmataceae bacterium]
MNEFNQAYQYFFINQNINYEDAIASGKKALEGKDPRRFYVYAILLQYFHDDDSKDAPYLEPTTQGEADGCPLSGILLAILLQQGRTIDKHPAKAYTYYQKYKKALEDLAYQGEPMAQSMLGFLYQSGLFVKKDIENAMRYYHQAQKQGLRIAYHQLGLLYQQKGAYQNERKGQELFEVVLKDQFVSSLFIKGLQQLKEKNEEKATHYLKQAVDLNYHHAMFSLGSYYMTKKQPEKAFELFMKASELGHLKATYMVALAYASGRG